MKFRCLLQNCRRPGSARTLALILLGGVILSPPGLTAEDILAPAVTSTNNITFNFNLISTETPPAPPAVTNLNGSVLPSNMDALDDKYHLAIGDKLSFRIIEDAEDPVGLVVTDSGEMELPYIGRFAAVGKTCKQLAGELKVEYQKDYYYQATVIVAVDAKTKDRGKVYLAGSVREPGPQETSFDEHLTLSKAILRAGGFTDYADTQHVKVTRQANSANDKEQTFVVNVRDIIENGKTDADMSLKSDDLVYVPERLVRF